MEQEKKKLLQEVTICDYVTELRRRKYCHRRGTQHLRVSEHTTLYGEFGLELLRPILGSRVLLQKRTSLNHKIHCSLRNTTINYSVWQNRPLIRIRSRFVPIYTPHFLPPEHHMLKRTSTIHLPSTFPTTIWMQSQVLCQSAQHLADAGSGATVTSRNTTGNGK